MTEHRVKAWAVVDALGNLTSWDGSYSIARTKKASEDFVLDEGERVVPVTIVYEEEK